MRITYQPYIQTLVKFTLCKTPFEYLTDGVYTQETKEIVKRIILKGTDAVRFFKESIILELDFLKESECLSGTLKRYNTIKVPIALDNYCKENNIKHDTLIEDRKEISKIIDILLKGEHIEHV